MVQKKYWTKIRDRAKQRARERDRAFQFVLFIVITLGGFGLHWLIFGRGAAMNELAVIVIYFVAALILTPFISLGWHILSEPALMDNEKNDEKNKLATNLNNIEKRVSRKNIKPLWPPLKRVRSNTQTEQMIQVENDSGKELSNYYAIVEKIGFRESKEIEIRTLTFPRFC